MLMGSEGFRMWLLKNPSLQNRLILVVTDDNKVVEIWDYLRSVEVEVK